MDLPRSESIKRVRNDYPTTYRWVFGHILWIGAALLFYLIMSGVL